MSEMTSDELKDAIASGEIGAISLDTSIFDGCGLRLESALLQRMKQFRGSNIQFVLSEIVAKEVVAHLTKGALEARTQFETARKGVEKHWCVATDIFEAIEPTVFQGRSAEAFAQGRFDSFVDAMNCEVIKASGHIDVAELLRRYFMPESPFSKKETKKNEFPDAFALLTLEAWAKRSGRKLLVVSKDDDWASFCRTSEALVLLDDLGSALGMFHRDAKVACNVLAQRLQNGTFRSLEDAIEESVERHVERMDFCAEADSDYIFDDEITDWYVEKLKIGGRGTGASDIEPIDAGDDYFVAKISVIAEVRIECNFYFSVKDGIDKDYVPIGSAALTASKSLYFDVLVTFSEPIAQTESFDDIEVSGKGRLYVDFGYIQPKWDEDPNSERY